MELRYHTCGCPIRVWEVGRTPSREPTFFDGRSSWTERAIRTCPGCGEQLSYRDLRLQPASPCGTLAAYMLAWPYVRQQLEALVMQHALRDPAFSVDRACDEIMALEQALNRVTELAARIETSAPSRSKAASILEAA